MSRLRTLIAKLRSYFGSSAADGQMADEIALHLELETEKNIQLGMAPAAARRAARLSFGAIESIKEDHRDGRGMRWFNELLADIRYAFRGLWRNPILGGTAVVTLAIGIGASTAIFSVVNAVVLRPLPFADPDRLMMIGEDNADFHWNQADAAPANYLDWREQSTVFSGMAAYLDFGGRITLTGQGAPQLLHAATVTGDFFSVLGVRPALGRAFDSSETWNTGTRIAVISDRAWHDLFHGDSAIVGRTQMLDGSPTTIVGIAPQAFGFPTETTEIWVPIGWNRGDRTKTWFRRAHFMKVIARVRPGISQAAANNALRGVVKRLQTQYPETNRIMGATMSTLQNFLARDIRTPLLILLSSVGFLLLIACANVGNLLLVRAVGRQRETALRVALGAGRARIARESMTYSLLLASLGGGLGCAVAWSGTRALLALRPSGILPTSNIGVDGRVLAFVILATTVSAVIFGLGPALWAGRRDPGEVLKQGGRTGSAAGSVRRAANLMIVAEVALAVVLAIGAGLLVRSFTRLADVRPGFEPTGVLTAGLDLPRGRYDSSTKVVRFYDELEHRIRALPGVASAASVSNPPLTSFPWGSQFSVAGRPPFSGGNDVVHREITSDYLAVMRVPLLRGRALTPQDGAGAPPVVLINDVIARKYFSDVDPIGQRITFDRIPDSTSHWRTIVGVVGTEHQAGPDVDPRAEFLAPLAQEGGRSAMTLMIRTTGDPVRMIPLLRRTVAEMDPDLALLSVQTMLEIRDKSLAARRFMMTLMLAFAGTGLLLGAVGVYGVMAQATAERRREMGIRIALGARAPRLQWMILRDGLQLGAFGVGVGLVGAFAGAHFMRSMLFGIEPIDPLTFTATGALLLAIATVATWLPAARASRVDPMESLRAE